MIAALPRSSAAPPEYRYALDSVMPLLSRAGPLHVISNVSALECEVLQRLPSMDESGPIGAGLWIEPLGDSWRADLATFAGSLPNGALLVIIASQPLARVMPGSPEWHVPALGSRPGGLRKLRHSLEQAGFTVSQRYGIRTMNASVLGLLGQVAERYGRPEWGDQLHFASRLRYCSTGKLHPLATVGLIVARREVS